MTKAEFLANLRAVYAVANRSDHETQEPWTPPEMAGELFCRPLDDIVNGMFDAGIFTQEEIDDFYA